MPVGKHGLEPSYLVQLAGGREGDIEMLFCQQVLGKTPPALNF